ncbi:MAG TPA: hypothetical protein VGS19_28990 [Streptosporangiaceae bacterium]|nr:hypothetical protein [Streptosporangiaceae bacterium]
MAEDMTPCRDVKHGRVTLLCELEEGHEGWHKAVYTQHEEVTYQGSHHVMDLTETVTWEPVDHLAEAVRHIAAKGRSSDG